MSESRPTSTPTSESCSEDLLRRGTETVDAGDGAPVRRVRFGAAPFHAPVRVDHAVRRLVMPPPPPLLLQVIPDPPQEVTVTTCTVMVNARQLAPHILDLPMILLVTNEGCTRTVKRQERHVVV